jgi:hypothetical protein
MTKQAYYIKQSNGDQQAVVLNSDGSTDVYTKDGISRIHAGDDRFAYYCHQLETGGYVTDTNPGWQAPVN